jgi:hypothetical protein
LHIKKITIIIIFILALITLVLAVQDNKIKYHYKTTNQPQEIEAIITQILEYKEQIKVSKCLEKKEISKCEKYINTDYEINILED